MNACLSASLTYAARGWRILPLKGKIPIIIDWPALATTDPETIRTWWTPRPNANVGIATGGQSNLLVLDVDPARGGDETLRALEAQYGALPNTIEVLTGGGGRHYYFLDPGIPIGNSAGKLGTGLDIKTEGGQVVAPPSIHPDTGRAYEWEAAHHPDDMRPAPAPQWLLNMLTAKSARRVGLQSGETFQEGQRNDALAREAGRLRRIGLNEVELAAALFAINRERCRPLLSDDEVRAIAASVSRYPAPSEAISSSTIFPTEALGGTWPDPLPLVAHVEAEAYPLDALPDIIREAVEEVQRFTKAPPAMVASSALAAVSVVAHSHYDVSRADKLAGPVSLFLLTIADSGERKSTCDGFFSSPIRDYEQEQAEIAKPEQKCFAAQFAAWKAEQDGTLSALKQAIRSGKLVNGKSVDTLRNDLLTLEQRKPIPPRVAKLLRGDDTPENLAWVLAREWPSAGVITAEAGIVLGSHGMGTDSVMRNLALLNTLWDGGTHIVGRRTSESFTVRGVRLTMGLQVQEATLRSFFDRSKGLARGTGFLARFLVSWPESTQGSRPFTDPPGAWPFLGSFHRRIADILNTSASIDKEGNLTPTLLSLAPDTKGAWIEFHDAIEDQLRTGGELYDVRDVASKTADNAARLAALFQVFCSTSSRSTEPIAVEHMESASRIVAWHLNESRRFFGGLALPPELADPARLDAWLLSYCQRERVRKVPTRTVQQFGPRGLREKASIEGAAGELAQLGRARLLLEGRNKSIEVNPALLSGGEP